MFFVTRLLPFAHHPVDGYKKDPILEGRPTMSASIFLNNLPRRRQINLHIGQLPNIRGAEVAHNVTTEQPPLFDNLNPAAPPDTSSPDIRSQNRPTASRDLAVGLLECGNYVIAKVDGTRFSSYIYDDAVEKYGLRSFIRPAPYVYTELAPAGRDVTGAEYYIDLTITTHMWQEASGQLSPHPFTVTPRRQGDRSNIEVVIGRGHPTATNSTAQASLVQGEADDFFGGSLGQQSVGMY